MRKFNLLIAITAILATISCQHQADNYASIQDFYSKNGVPMQTYTINGTTGGSFTSPQGTVVTIPANAFVTQGSVPVTSDVTIEFKDIYKKSDMLLSNTPTNYYTGIPLKSGGEFYLKASFNGSAVLMASGKSIILNQPISMTGVIDSSMTPLIAYAVTPNDTPTTNTVNITSWYPTDTSGASLQYSVSSYIYSFNQFNPPLESGTWSNSDNPYFFSSFTQTLLTLSPNENISSYWTQLFLLFNSVNSAVHIYDDGTSFPYSGAPQGLQCTVVAFGVKDGKLYSSFLPITIGANQTYNFSLTETNTVEFKTELEALN